MTQQPEMTAIPPAVSTRLPAELLIEESDAAQETHAVLSEWVAARKTRLNCRTEEIDVQPVAEMDIGLAGSLPARSERWLTGSRGIRA